MTGGGDEALEVVKRRKVAQVEGHVFMRSMHEMNADISFVPHCMDEYSEGVAPELLSVCINLMK